MYLPPRKPFPNPTTLIDFNRAHRRKSKQHITSLTPMFSRRADLKDRASLVKGF